MAPRAGAARSRGVALVTALLVVALAAAAAAWAGREVGLSLARGERLAHAAQAALYARGMEAWALRILAADDPAVDHGGERWARPVPPLPVEGGAVRGAVTSPEGRLNLNDLLRSEAARARFVRLCRLVDVDPGILPAILDWLDPDQTPRAPGGAEDEYYTLQDPAYRAANGPFADVRELRRVRGVDEAAYRRLAPYVAALPGEGAINVNLAPPLILQTLAEGLTEADAAALAEARAARPFGSVDELLRQPALAGRAVAKEGLAVASRFFVVRAEARVGRARARLASVVLRRRGVPTVVGRSLGRTGVME